MSSSRTQWVGWIAALAIAALFAFANTLRIDILWGFNLAAYPSPVWLYAGLGFISLSFLPQTTTLLLTLSERLSDFVDRTPLHRRVIGVMAVLVFGTICWFGSVSLPLLGDGSLRCREITDGEFWQPTEALDFLLHALTFNFITKPLRMEVTQAFRYISIFSGMIFLIGTYQLSTYLSRKRWLLLTFAALGLGVTTMFFGYIESYSIVAALIPWLVLTGIRVSDGCISAKWFLALVILAGLFHSVMFLLFVSSALLLLTLNSDTRRQWLLSRLWLFWTAGLFLVAILVVLKILNVPMVSIYVLPVLPTATENVALVSLPYLLNLINWVLLSGLAIVPLSIWVRIPKSSQNPSPRKFLAYSLVIPAVVFILLFPPMLGGPIDWDLFSLPLAIIAFALMPLVEDGKVSAFPRWALPILTVALVNTVSFVAINHSTTVSAERFSRIIPLSASSNPWIHWSSLVVHAEHQPVLFNRRNEFLLKSWQAPPNNKRDSVTTLTKLMRESVQANDSLSTRRILQILNSIEGLPPEVLASETDALVRFGSRDEQREFAEMLAAAFPSSPIALGAAGILYMNLGEIDQCGALLAQSYALDSTNFRVNLNYGVYLVNKQEFQTAAPVLKQALTLDGKSFFAAYYLANAYLALGDIAGAKEAMLRAEANALRPEEQNRIKDLKMRF